MRRFLCRRCSVPIFWRRQRGMNLCRGCRPLIPAIIGDLFTNGGVAPPYVKDHEHQWSDFSLQCQDVHCEATRPSQPEDSPAVPHAAPVGAAKRGMTRRDGDPDDESSWQGGAP